MLRDIWLSRSVSGKPELRIASVDLFMVSRRLLRAGAQRPIWCQRVTTAVDTICRGERGEVVFIGATLTCIIHGTEV